MLLQKNPSRQQLRDALGVDPALIAGLFTGSTAKVNATLAKLHPKMHAFFLAAGLPAKTATLLTQ